MSKLKNYKRSEMASWQSFDENTIVLTVKERAVHELNEVASLVWRGVVDQKSSESIVEEICLQFDVNLNRATVDVCNLLNQFEKNKMVVLRE